MLNRKLRRKIQPKMAVDTTAEIMPRGADVADTCVSSEMCADASEHSTGSQR